MLERDLYVEEGTGMIREVKHWRGFVFSDEPFRPHGKYVFINPMNSLLEEGEPLNNPFERFLQQSNYRRLSDFKSNENPVLFHPERKEFAEVRLAYNPSYWEKVRDFFIS